MTWTLSPRPTSKTTDPSAKPSAPSQKPAAPPKPQGPSKDGKPPHPYPAPEGQYWRWTEKTAAFMGEQDIDEAVRYILDVLRSQGVTDPASYIAAVDREDRQRQARDRRAHRMAAFRA